MSHKATRLRIDRIVVGACWSISIIGFLLLLVVGVGTLGRWIVDRFLAAI